jgi:hypothetical protein
MEQMNYDCLELICEYLEYKDLIQLSQTCSYAWKMLAELRKSRLSQIPWAIHAEYHFLKRSLIVTSLNVTIGVARYHPWITDFEFERNYYEPRIVDSYLNQTPNTHRLSLRGVGGSIFNQLTSEKDNEANLWFSVSFLNRKLTPIGFTSNKPNNIGPISKSCVFFDCVPIRVRSICRSAIERQQIKKNHKVQICYTKMTRINKLFDFEEFIETKRESSEYRQERKFKSNKRLSLLIDDRPTKRIKI